MNAYALQPTIHKRRSPAVGGRMAYCLAALSGRIA
jgi:hypothetical protein